MNDDASLLRTPLHDLHLEHGAKMVPFAGYHMPVQYAAGIKEEHLHTRRAAGLFDVSHMGQVSVGGEHAAEALETLVPMDVLGLRQGRQRYALFTNDQGGIRDDLMITRREDDFLLVVNAACKAADLDWLRASIGDRCQVEALEDRALLALQGPGAVAVLAGIAPAVAELRFMEAAAIDLGGIDGFVSRSGYTGEDGVEISLPAADATAFARRLLDHPEVAPIGLGARDSLRLEAGLCLYGHDIDTTTTPVEADLAWSIQKVRRHGGERAGGFPGAAVVLDQLANGAARRRVGIRSARAPVREGAELFDADGNLVGNVTSGGFGPSVDGPVAMGYVAAAHAARGTPLTARLRNRSIEVTVEATGFVAHRYAR